MSETKTDSIVEAVRADLLRRSQFGIAKYGTTLDRTDLSLRNWCPSLRGSVGSMTINWNKVTCELAPPEGLSATDMKEQAARCPCRGSDDYCTCQNVPDRTTLEKRQSAR